MDVLMRIVRACFFFYTRKMHLYPEFIFNTDSGVMCVDIHKQLPHLVAVGLNNGCVAVYDLLEESKQPIYTSTASSGKHKGSVMQHCSRPLFSGGQNEAKSVETKAVDTAQTRHAVAEEIGDILKEYAIFDKVVAATVDNAANMDIAIKRLVCETGLLCSHTQSYSTESLLPDRTIIVWMKRSSMAKVVLREKQDLLSKNQ
ncbi:unnamed protein product [Leuciscus chuanchicus]